MTRLIRLLAAVLALMVGLTVTGAVPAVAEPGDTWTLTGTVIGSNGEGAIADAGVSVWSGNPMEDDDAELFDGDVTDDDGAFTIADVPEGTGYYLLVDADGYESSVSDPFDLTGDRTFNGYRLASASSVMGTVTVGGDEPECGVVYVYDAAGDGQDEDDYLETNGDGSFDYELPAGSYKFLADEECDFAVPAWFGGGTSFATAETFTVNEGEVTDLGSIDLDDGSTVSGTVTLKDAPATKLSHVEIYLEADAKDGDDLYTTTKADGTYSLENVPDGSYTFSAEDPLGEYADSDPRPLTVAGSDLVGQDFALAAAPASTKPVRLQGSVRGSDRVVLPGALVTLVKASDGTMVDRTIVTRNGSYAFRGTRPGSYKIHVAGPYDFDDDFEGEYVDEWYDNVQGFRRAKSVAIAASGPAVKVDATLAKKGAIEGRILFPATAEPDHEGYVTLYDLDGNQVSIDSINEDGTYRFSRVVPGTYKVRVDAYSFAGDDDDDEDDEDRAQLSRSTLAAGAAWSSDSTQFIREFFNNKYSVAAGNGIAVGDNQTRTKIDIAVSDVLSATTLPKVSGTAKKGKTLTAGRGVWSMTVDTEYAYQWFRGASAIRGATGSTYKLTSADVGKQIRVRVVGSNRYDLYRDGVAYSTFTAKVTK